MNDNSEEKKSKAPHHHEIAEMAEIHEALAGVFKPSWISTVEEAVSFLSRTPFELDGKADFLAKARQLIGEEAFAKYSAPAKRHPLGLNLPEEVPVFAKSADEPAAEKPEETQTIGDAENKQDGGQI